MIFFLHGADSYRARRKLKEIEEKYRATYPGAHQVRYFDCPENKAEEAQTVLESVSLFEAKTMLVFFYAFGEKAFETLLWEKKKQLAEDKRRIVVLFEQGEIKNKGTNKLYQWLRKNAKHQEFTLLSGTQLMQWASLECASYNLSLTPQALEVLLLAVGNDLWRLSGEIRKIAAWKYSTATKQIKEADVALLVDVRKEADIFSTIDAVAQKNPKQAFALLYRHLQKGDSPFYLFSMLCYQMRIILQLQDATERRLPEKEIIKKTKLHPYVLKKNFQIARKFSSAELKKLYEDLFFLDKDLKTGRREPEVALDLFIARFLP